MPLDDFKVVIAGGGIAGLTLAIMLEKFDIDYVILESYSKIAPPVGASVGLFPNGLRILDQLGCYEEIKRRYDLQQRGNTNHRDKYGKLVAALPNEAGQYEVRCVKLYTE
jgi:2-polyprenyl-6-methoxyphenol hydroxylase-like FAD-dependent oxidoreductase